MNRRVTFVPYPDAVRDDTARARYRLALALITLAATTVSVCWALLTPSFRAPDEAQHLNSALRLAHGGGWPQPGTALLSPGVATAREEAALDSDVPGRYLDRPDVPAFVRTTPVPDAERTVVGPGNGLIAALSPETDTSTWNASKIDQMTQHPPLYYVGAAGWLHVTGTAEARWDHQVLALRLFDVLLFAPVPLLAAGAARRLTDSRAAGLVAAAFPLFLPQLGHITGSITNDALVILAGAAAAYGCARVVTGDLRWRTAAGLGAVLGLALLTKVMAAFTLPAVVLAYALAAPLGPTFARIMPGRWHGAPRVTAHRRAGRRVGAAAVTLGVAFVVGGWWWLRNLVLYGAVQPVGIPDRFEPVEDRGVWYFLSTTVTHLTRSFFGNFGLLDVRVPDAVFWTAAGALAALCVVALYRPGGVSRRALAVLLLQPALLWCAVVANAWSGYSETGWVIAVQGRYLFGGVLPFAVAVAVVVPLAAGRRAGVVPWIVGAGGVVAASGLVHGFRGFYRGVDEAAATALERWAGWSPLTGTQLAVWAVVTVCVVVSAVVVAARYARRTATAAPIDATTAAVPAVAASTTGSE